jgi:glycosyltransferase involved in cell wall biosynthesis
MRVSIITPSFNQAQFLEQTILSILNQSFADIEYIVIDGGSTDGSVEIIEKYRDRLAYWHSRKDRGHWDAVRQGFEKATGDILHFLNSDDLLIEGAVERVVQAFQTHPKAGVVYGKAKFIDADGADIQDYPSEEFDIARVFRTWSNPVSQPTAFLRKQIFEKYGSPDEDWPFCADFEYWIRISSETTFHYLQEYLACMRIHSATKTARNESVQAEELIQLCNKWIPTTRFAESGVAPEEAVKGAYLCASMHFRRSGAKRKALQSYFSYCRSAFTPPMALYRFIRYLAGMILNRW